MIDTRMVLPRDVPNRDSKYMGLAWMYAGLSKDPNTQVGAVIVDQHNCPLGHGYNGPPRLVDDNAFNWERPQGEQLEQFNKYDIIVHAEVNAIEHSCARELTDATLYVTGLPCPRCMLEIARKEMGRVVYMDFRSSPGSTLANAKWHERSWKIAEMAGIKVEEFKGDVAWLQDWVLHLREIGVFRS